MHINLATSFANEEVIISDSGGKVLLDTMSPYPNPLVATLPTAQTLVDLALVTYDTVHTTYFVTDYKGVNPSKWTNLESSGYYNVVYPHAPSTITNTAAVYVNPPAVAYTNLLCNDYVSGFGSTSGMPAPGYLDVTYQLNAPGNYTYLIFPLSGLYNFHIPPQTGADTTDLSKMDTATIVNFTKPPDYTIQSIALYGIIDTTDLARSVYLYNKYSTEAIPDLEYPGTTVEDMELFITATNADGTAHYYSYGNSIPSNLAFPEPSSYTVSSNQGNNFAVNFGSNQPSYYFTQWGNGKIGLTLFAPGDSTSLNPQAILTAMNSKLMQGQSFSGLQLNDLFFETPAGLDCAGFFALEHNPAQLQTQRVPSSVSFFKSF